MLRVASHFLLYKQCYRLHYVELDTQDRVTAIRPLTEELSSTEFYNGIVLIVPEDRCPMDWSPWLYAGCTVDPAQLCRQLQPLWEGEEISSMSVELYLLSPDGLTATKLRTHHSCGNRHIQ